MHFEDIALFLGKSQVIDLKSNMSYKKQVLRKNACMSLIEKLKPRLAPLPAEASLLQPAMLLATWFGAGLFRPAPGTIGTLTALPFGFLIAWLCGPPGLLVAAILFYFIGVWAAGRYGKASGETDNQSIVIDEVVGVWIAAIPAGIHWQLWIWAFLLFRFFDITKPWPASFFDRKKAWGGHSVMLDDVMAGIFALAGTGTLALLLLEP